MKELSIKEKAKRYDKAIEITKSKIKNDKDHVLYEEDVIEIFPELKESEDEKIRKEIIKLVKFFYGSSLVCKHTISKDKMVAWLEKQGEQKPVEWCSEDEQNLNVCLSYIPHEFLKRWLKDIIHIKYDKPIDKAESKFRVDDFIKHNKANLICKVISVNSGSYYLENIETSCRIELFYAEEDFHLWTIEDAKDGDVLVYEDYDAVKIFIYLYGKVHCYCCLTNSTFVPHSFYFGVQEDQLYRLHPADKKQRDLLFAKMKKEGYEWNADTKVLNKQKSSSKDFD